MRLVLFSLIFFPALSFAHSEFIVGLESNLVRDLPVEVAVQLVAKNPLCVQVSERGLISKPVAKVKILKQTQLTNDDIYEYKFKFNSGICLYVPEAVFINVESKNYVIYQSNDASKQDVVIFLEENIQSTNYVKFGSTYLHPNVYISLVR